MIHESNLHLTNYNGPLDVLVELIKDKKLDIFEIDLAELAIDYLRIIQELKTNNIDLASEYLVMAATLIQLKAKMLLDSPELQEEIELERQDLLNQIIEYQQFKKISGILKTNEKKRKEIFIKKPSSYSGFKIEVDETQLDGTMDPIKLIIALRKMFERMHAKQLKETIIEKFNLSPAERRIEILKILKTNETPSFEQIFNVPTINHFVVTVLTILDMSRKQELLIYQNEQFGTIKFKKGIINE